MAAENGNRRYVVALSDVHIGSGTPTCWYQSSVQEPQLAALLRWILGNRASIREVVLLGDIFELWTYPPAMRPPSMADIIAPTRGYWARTGRWPPSCGRFPTRFACCAATTTGASPARTLISSTARWAANVARGERIELVASGTHLATGKSGKRTVFTHGHSFCMFNAPDFRSKWSTIPIGHFVTRAISYKLSKTLPPGKTAADTSNSGNPTGVDLTAIAASWKQRGDLAAFLIEYICDPEVTGMPKTLPIVMPDGSTTTAQEAARVFAGLFTMWQRRLGRIEDALRAATADWGGGNDLAFFAARAAMQTSSDLAVVGHTHSAVAGVDVSPVDYVNTGYECVSRPDAVQTPFTFARVDLERATSELFAVVKTPTGFGVAPSRARRLPSVVRGRDYSCYARIENHTTRPLKLLRSAKDKASFWVVPPPAVINPQARADIWVQDTVAAQGSSGRFSYSDGMRTYAFAISCPVMSRNSVTSPVPYATKVGNGSWRASGVEPSGYPVQARFYVGAPRPLGPSVVPPALGPGKSPSVPPRHTATTSGENPYVIAARQILDQSQVENIRGEVLCVAYLRPYTGSKRLINPATDASRQRLIDPPAHLSGAKVFTTSVRGQEYKYVWIQSSAALSPPLVGGMAFFDDKGQLAVVTFNVAGVTAKWRDRCTNKHHAEMQLRRVRERPAGGMATTPRRDGVAQLLPARSPPGLQRMQRVPGRSRWLPAVSQPASADDPDQSEHLVGAAVQHDTAVRSSHRRSQHPASLCRRLGSAAGPDAHPAR